MNAGERSGPAVGEREPSLELFSEKGETGFSTKPVHYHCSVSILAEEELIEGTEDGVGAPLNENIGCLVACDFVKCQACDEFKTEARAPFHDFAFRCREGIPRYVVWAGIGREFETVPWFETVTQSDLRNGGVEIREGGRGYDYSAIDEELCTLRCLLVGLISEQEEEVIRHWGPLGTFRAQSGSVLQVSL